MPHLPFPAPAAARRSAFVALLACAGCALPPPAEDRPLTDPVAPERRVDSSVGAVRPPGPEGGAVDGSTADRSGADVSAAEGVDSDGSEGVGAAQRDPAAGGPGTQDASGAGSGTRGSGGASIGGAAADAATPGEEDSTRRAESDPATARIGGTERVGAAERAGAAEPGTPAGARPTEASGAAEVRVADAADANRGSVDRRPVAPDVGTQRPASNGETAAIEVGAAASSP
ncbi:MAG: hypothetical protein AAFP86_05595, partial [Planctomycetota bacterium]